ncbi:PhzF family phenazine biosynthesis protein [uncultured Aquincola sp.]|uniref:PhzF family phenazine biosynthesis protein n=1 Tax=uncultured Aquincola sp. TaxID=886556 RepID=UPI0032B1A906
MSTPTSRRFTQLDVFTGRALYGNPLAVVHDAEGLSDERMAAFARWTNLSETTFLLPPTDPQADYRVRIFTPIGELPFAGHPTLGSCHAWLQAGGQPQGEQVVQQCEVGLVRVQRQMAGDVQRLAFAAPPRRREGPLPDEVLDRVCAGLKIPRDAILHHAWCDNGPGWAGVMLDSAADVLALHCDYAALGDVKLGVVAPHPAGHEAQFELRAFIGGGNFEDPVTGSLNAAVAQWLMGAGLAPQQYVAAQGTALGRAGRVYLSHDGTDVWVGGEVAGCIEGRVSL